VTIGFGRPPPLRAMRAPPLFFSRWLPARVGWASLAGRSKVAQREQFPLLFFPLDLFESNSNNSKLLKFVVKQMNSIKI
jgi:hypothetical protein